jgi:tetratricopeptide (TPR) repeat protein
MSKTLRFLLIFIPVVCIISAFTYFLPPVHDRLAWRVDETVLRVKYALNPPEKVIFVPGAQLTATIQETIPTPVVFTPTNPPTNSPVPTLVAPQSTATPGPTAVPTNTATPIPLKVALSGVEYTTQHGRLNYCAPANLTMALSYWGWPAVRNEVGEAVKPDERDKNVMPYELADYVVENTDLGVITRVGGDIELAKRLISAGYPVLVEKGTFLVDISNVYSWMGHYQVLTGYDETEEVFIAQDSYRGADWEISYDDLIDGWRAFNYTYIVIYPEEKEGQVMELLGPDADEVTNYQNAALLASNEVVGLTGIEKFFAWFNRGTNLMRLQDYAGAAAAYDEAFAVYPTIPEEERPWRMMWYQTGPYFAYFYSQRYWDVISLADTTLNAMQSEKSLEESYYWRGMAKAALGDTAGAIADYRMSLEFHPDFGPSIFQLNQLGAAP